MTTAETSLYLSENYAPVAEEVTAFDLPVIGELPVDLVGRYLRNGPNPFDAVDPAAHHWFVGAGMVHGVRLDGGRAAWYRNRYVGSTELSAHRGEPDIAGPNWNASAGGPNTNVGGFAGTTWAMVEAGGCPVRAHLRTRHRRSQRLLRYTSRRIHGASEGSTLTPARCTPSSTPGRTTAITSSTWSSARMAGCVARSTCRCPA